MTSNPGNPGNPGNLDLQRIHQNIHNKLDVFIKNRKIPNIIFYGPHGSGKTYNIHVCLMR